MADALREAAQQALEALELHANQYPHMVKGYTLDAEQALRAALAAQQAPQADPVQWIESINGVLLELRAMADDAADRGDVFAQRVVRVLDAAPAAQQAPQAEPVAALMRSRHVTTWSHCAVDGKTHYSDWGGWIPTTYQHAKAVTDPSRNTDPVCYEMQPLYAAPAAPAGWQPTEAQIVAAARALNKRHAELCNVNEADSWMIQGNDFREDARAALLAAAPTHTQEAK